MPVEISVGPAALTINQGSTFMVTDLNGEITPESELGVFAGDTRFVNRYRIFASGLPWQRLTSSTTTYYTSQVHLTNPPLATEDGDIPGGQLGLVISRAVGEGVHEDLDLTNYGMEPVHLKLELQLGTDFIDLFEVKSHKFVRRGRIDTDWQKGRGELRCSYNEHDFHRAFVFRIHNSDSPPYFTNGWISFEVEIAPGGTWHTCCYYILEEGSRTRSPIHRCAGERSETRYDQLQRRWQETATALDTSCDDMRHLYQQSIEDMSALRIYDHDFGPDVWLPAAGVPWFVAIFGRDSLIASLQNMLVNPGFAQGALKKLAEYQATERDDYRDAEPGKILHELRVGELAHFRKVPHTPYYGTADATILYPIVLHEAWRWLGDDKLLREYRDVALRCLDWIDQYGDLDGDGFQEYQTRSSLGYENVGWKDSGEAVVYPDGTQVTQPKALCELQGYVFDAWMRMAEVFDALAEPERAMALRRKAVDLQARFEERFWCEDIGFYAYGLDKNKQPIKTIASNPGHCLWSGIASPEHAARVVQRIMQPDMSTGWGIRTLSALNPAYNPIAYQLGSVWPHDNGIIALGFKRYGFAAEAARVAHDITDAASYFVSYRLPELYAGIERHPGSFPVQYLGANVPQAWAAGSVFHFVQAILGLQADAPNGRLTVDPQLPDWLPDLKLQGMDVGKSQLDLRFWREGEKTRWEVLSQKGDKIMVQEQPWRPWLAERT